jgi:hypothetical protein
VTAAPDQAPPPLIAQLRSGGRMVIPVGRRNDHTHHRSARPVRAFDPGVASGGEPCGTGTRACVRTSENHQDRLKLELTTLLSSLLLTYESPVSVRALARRRARGCTGCGRLARRGLRFPVKIQSPLAMCASSVSATLPRSRHQNVPKFWKSSAANLPTARRTETAVNAR